MKKTKRLAWQDRYVPLISGRATPRRLKVRPPRRRSGRNPLPRRFRASSIKSALKEKRLQIGVLDALVAYLRSVRADVATIVRGLEKQPPKLPKVRALRRGGLRGNLQS